MYRAPFTTALMEYARSTLILGVLTIIFQAFLRRNRGRLAEKSFVGLPSLPNRIRLSPDGEPRISRQYSKD